MMAGADSEPPSLKRARDSCNVSNPRLLIAHEKIERTTERQLSAESPQQSQNTRKRRRRTPSIDFKVSLHLAFFYYLDEIIIEADDPLLCDEDEAPGEKIRGRREPHIECSLESLPPELESPRAGGTSSRPSRSNETAADDSAPESSAPIVRRAEDRTESAASILLSMRSGAAVDPRALERDEGGGRSPSPPPRGPPRLESDRRGDGEPHESSDGAREGGKGRPDPSLRKLPKNLGHPDDPLVLNELHCLVRSELTELFVVTGVDRDGGAGEIPPSNVKFAEKISRKHFVGRVGVRCVHCAGVATCGERAVGSSFYPRCIADLYRQTCYWHMQHIPFCPSVPEDVRAEYLQLKAECKQRGKTVHWERTAKEMGFKDKGGKTGIFFEPDECHVDMHQKT